MWPEINSWAGHNLSPLFWLIICQQLKETRFNAWCRHWRAVMRLSVNILNVSAGPKKCQIPFSSPKACKWEHLANITHINLSNLCHLEKNEAVQMLLLNLMLHKDHLWCGSGCAKLKSLITQTEGIVWTSVFKKSKYVLKTRTIVL